MGKNQEMGYCSQENQSKGSESKKPCSDLSIDVWELIYQQLNWEGRLRFRAVCKSWNTIHNNLNTQPWLMSYSQDSTFKFRGPPLSKPYTNKIVDDKIQSCSDVNVIAAKKGWLLATKNRNIIFCYNPFTSQFSQLPNLFDFDSGSNPKAIFSAPVNSPDCVIFVIKCGEFISISLYFYGHGSLKEYKFDSHDDLIECKDVTYNERKFYCVFNNGFLGIFGLDDHNWSLENPFLPTILQDPSLQDQYFLTLQGQDMKSMPRNEIEFQKFHLMESGGDIFMVCSGSDLRRFSLFKLNCKKMAWIEVRNLRNGAIFLNDGSSSIKVSTEQIPTFSNKILYFSDKPGFIWSFCLDTYKHKICDEFNGSLLESGAKEIWIDPPN